MSTTREFVNFNMQKHILSFAKNFEKRYMSKGTGIKNLIYKANNPFINALGEEIVIYSALMRSLDSSLGNVLEKLARDLAEASYIVNQKVEGDVPLGIDKKISELMGAYVEKKRIPCSSDIREIEIEDRASEFELTTTHKIHKSDYHLIRKSDQRQHFLLELKIGGDLDNKKARSEKQALLEQYAILKYSQQIQPDTIVKLYFATAYNKFGEEEVWKQERVRQFFGKDELLIGRDFWNFICDSNEGNAMVLGAYEDNVSHLRQALTNIINLAKQNRNSTSSTLWSSDEI